MSSVAGWLTVLIGTVHIGFTTCAYDRPSYDRPSYDRPSLDALWFAGSIIAVVLVGALTLLARGTTAGIARVAVAANGAGVALALAFGVLTRWSEPQGPILVATFLAGGAAAWSIDRATLRPQAAGEDSRAA